MKTSDSIERVHFDAPWSTGLKVSTGFLAAVVLGGATACAIYFTLSAHPQPVGISVLVVSAGPAALLTAALFAVRGYEVKPDALYIQRPLWQTCVPLRGLREVTADSQAMRGAFKVCGSSGFLCHVGWFASRKLGRFKACATDPKNAVVLRFENRTWVVTPDDPAQFISRIKQKAGLVT
jgi:hypothetical protein